MQETLLTPAASVPVANRLPQIVLLRTEPLIRLVTSVALGYMMFVLEVILNK